MRSKNGEWGPYLVSVCTAPSSLLLPTAHHWLGMRLDGAGTW